MKVWYVSVDVTLIKYFFLNFPSFQVVTKKLRTNFEKLVKVNYAHFFSLNLLYKSLKLLEIFYFSRIIRINGVTKVRMFR